MNEMVLSEDGRVTGEQAEGRMSGGIPGRLWAVAGAVAAALAITAYFDLHGMLLAGRFLITAILGALVVYQTILAFLGYRGRLVGPRNEERIWVENASVGLALLLVVVIVWLP